MKTKALLSVLLAAAVTAGCSADLAASTATTAPVASAVDDTNDDWLHAEGSRLFDSNGNEVWLTGANWFGMNCSENAPHGLYATEADPFLSAVADHGINIIRFPVSSELLISWMNGEPLEVSSVQCWGDETQGFNVEFLEDDGKTTKNSLEIFEILLTKLKKYGLKCFIDVHSPHSDNSGHVWEFWYGKAGVTTESWIESLVWTADHFKNDDTVLGYDLENEPHGKGQDGDKAAKWDDSTDENNWQYAAQTCAEAILDANPNALIFVEGVEQSLKDENGYWGMPDSLTNSPYYGAWWGGNFRGARKYPIKPKQGTSQIVYSPHDYGPSVYNQTWFDKDFDEQSLLDDYWYDTWAYINLENMAPLLIGEWGGHMDDGKNQKWMCLLRDFMIKHHINHTFWCLNPNSGDTGGLLGNDFKTWDNDKYALFEKSLWKTDSGKYIGLDHKTALGANGISLSEYYASGESSNLDGGSKGTQGSAVVITTGTTTSTTQTTTSTTVTSTTSTTPKTTGQTLLGDVNCDGFVDVKDAVMLARYVGNDGVEISDEGIANGELNKTAALEIEDLNLLVQYIAHVISEDDLK